jgi:membrane protease subunit HflC
VNQEAGALGVDIVDVRIKRVDLPEANMQAIYRRMQTERQREAAEFRAEGEGAARRIRATADREVTVIKAEATGESERIRGAGDGERNRIFAEAFGQDPDFFAFYRSMQAYEGSLKPGDTRLLLSPNSQFFQYFNNAFGKAVQESAPGTADPADKPDVPAEGAKLPEPATGTESSTAPEHEASRRESLPPAPKTP